MVGELTQVFPHYPCALMMMMSTMSNEVCEEW